MGWRSRLKWGGGGDTNKTEERGEKERENIEAGDEEEEEEGDRRTQVLSMARVDSSHGFRSAISRGGET